MRKHKSIFNKLTKRELVHLVESLDGEKKFKVMREFQIHEKDRSGMEACWDCRIIARKLGFE